MAVARLVMQEWRDNYQDILERSKIDELLSGLYIDDGRNVQRLHNFGERFVAEENEIKVIPEKVIEDTEMNRCRQELRRLEINKAMNSVNPDLSFTMEFCKDFPENRMPTLSFSLWPEKDGINTHIS